MVRTPGCLAHAGEASVVCAFQVGQLCRDGIPLPKPTPRRDLDRQPATCVYGPLSHSLPPGVVDGWTAPISIESCGTTDLKPRAPEIIVAMQRDLAARREQIANEMKSIPVQQRPAIIGAVALKYGVCNGTVRIACREYHVDIPKISR